MDAIVKMLEKHQPFFEKISRNVYLQAIKDGFLGCMPIVLTSSIFLLIATLPGVVGITLPQPLIDWCNKLYNFTMGVMGIMVAGTTAKNFTASMNRRMPAGKVLNDGSTIVAAQCSMLLLAVTQFTTKLNGSELSVFDCTSMGTRGLFSAYIAAFITVWVYKFCVSRDLTIKLPKEVPGAIAQNFRDIIPFGGAVIICGIIDVVVRNLMGVPFSELLIKLLSPLFTAAETYPDLSLSRQPPRSSGSSASTVLRLSSRASTPSVLPTRPRTCRFCWPVVTPPTPSPLTCRSWVSSAAPAPRSSCRFC